MRHATVILVLASVLAGCTVSPSASPGGEVSTVHFVNVDGPKVAISLGGQVISTVGCGAAVVLEPGQGSLPNLPWDLTVTSSTGTVLGAAHLANPGPDTVLIRETTVLVGTSPMSYGPAPASPCPIAPAT
jgi:hypothetical protein